MLLRKDKTCPHCRAVVRDAPVEAWGIKDIVNHIFAHKGDAAKDLFPSHTEPQEARPGSSGPDAWKGVFRRLRAIVPILGTGGFRHVAIHDDDLRNDDDNDVVREHGDVQPFFDEEDGVYRCTDCYHEIWDGVCSSCGRQYPGHRDEIGDEDEEVDAGTWMDAEDFHGLEGNAIGEGLDEHVEGIMGALGFRRRILEGIENDIEDEDDYDSSFIDDEDDHARMEEYHSAEEARGYDSEDIEMGLVNDDEDSVPRRVPPPRVDESDNEGPPPVHLGTIEILDSDSDTPVVPVNRQRAQAARIRIDSDSDDSIPAGSQRAGRAPGSSRVRHAIITDSDSEPDEDE